MVSAPPISCLYLEQYDIFSMYIDNSIGISSFYIILTRFATEDRGVLVWEIHIAPRWQGCTGSGTDR